MSHLKRTVLSEFLYRMSILPLLPEPRLSSHSEYHQGTKVEGMQSVRECRGRSVLLLIAKGDNHACLHRVHSGEAGREGGEEKGRAAMAIWGEPNIHPL